MSALDEDLDANGQLTYFIQKGNINDLFSITPNGTFQILHSLDREKESLYIVTIISVDAGNLSPNQTERSFKNIFCMLTSFYEYYLKLSLQQFDNKCLFSVISRITTSNRYSYHTYHSG